MKHYEAPAVKTIIQTVKYEPPKEPKANTDEIMIFNRAPSIYLEDLNRFHKQQLAETFSFKRKGFRKHQK